ncbi:hypothetical protein ASswx1_373 [Aeromonas phage Asswx_1]|uniref:Uncharacterized protein n=1 Tax=Aeromonas phage Asswx_1 TaxID=2419739 RepID=A0A411B8T8_9CAUD|nr:hypothetical protein ASswx1_373 [Aeromonas phage Asswx_1]
MELNYIYADKRILTNVRYDYDYTSYPWRAFQSDGYSLLVYKKGDIVYSMEIVDKDVYRDSMYFGFKCDNYCSINPSIYLFDVTKMDMSLQP